MSGSTNKGDNVKFSVGRLLAALTVAAAVASAGIFCAPLVSNAMNYKEDLKHVNTSLVDHDSRIIKLEEFRGSAKETLAEIKRDTEKLNEKIDWIIQREIKR